MVTLFDLAKDLTSQMTVSDAGDVITKHLRRLVPCSLCVFYLYQVDSDELVAAYATGENASVISGLRVGVGQRLSGWVAANRQTIRNSDPVLDFGDAARSLPTRPKSCLSTPMMAGSNLVGVVSLYANERNAFSDEHQRILEVVSRQVSAFIQSASHCEPGKTSSIRDSVSGGHSIEPLTQVTDSLNAADSLTYPVTALVVKINFLGVAKRPENEALREISFNSIVREIRQRLRSVDLLVRSSPEELVALLPRTDADSSASVARRLRSGLGAITSQRPDGQPIVEATITASPLHQDSLSVRSFLKSFKSESGGFRTTSPGPTSESVH